MDDQVSINARILAEEKNERQWNNWDPVREEVAALRREVKQLQNRKSFDGAKFGTELADMVVDYVKKAVGKAVNRLENEMNDRIDACFRGIDDQRERLGKLEKRGNGLLYRGVFQRAENYVKGDCVTFDGSLWIALGSTSETPNQSKQWQLAAKAR